MVPVIDLFKRKAGLHTVLGMAMDQLAFQLEHDDGDSLNGSVDRVQIRIAGFGKHRQRTQADTVTAFQHGHVAVSNGIAHHGGNAAFAAAGGAHPENIMVAPFDVHIAAIHQKVHNAVRARTAVIDVAHHMQPFHCQPLDQRGQRTDEGIAAFDLDDGFQNALVIKMLVVVLIRLGMHQLIQYKSKLLRHVIAHFAAGMLAGKQTGQLQHAAERTVIPFPVRRMIGMNALELFFGIVNQRAKLAALGVGELVAVEQAQFFTDHAGAVVQNLLHAFKLAVQITDEMLGAFRQIANGAQVDDLCIQRGHGRKLLAQQFEIFDAFW